VRDGRLRSSSLGMRPAVVLAFVLSTLSAIPCRAETRSTTREPEGARARVVQPCANALAMRDVEGCGPLVRPHTGLPGLDTALSFDDYTRIVGSERVEAERRAAARALAAYRGKWQQVVDAIPRLLDDDAGQD
jgi:hypothetical protein